MPQRIILDYKNFDVSKLRYQDPKKTKSGSYLAEPYYEDNNQIYDQVFIQTPKIVCINDLELNGPRTYLDLKLDNRQERFSEFLNQLDEYNVETAFTNSSNWFNKSFTLDVIEDFYKTPIKPQRANKPSSIRFRVPTIKGELSCQIYNQKRELSSNNLVKADCEMIGIFQIVGLKFLKQQFVPEMSLFQMKVYDSKQKTQLLSYMINDESDEDEDIPEPDDNLENLINDEEIMPEENDTETENETETQQLEQEVVDAVSNEENTSVDNNTEQSEEQQTEEQVEGEQLEETEQIQEQQQTEEQLEGEQLEEQQLEEQQTEEQQTVEQQTVEQHLDESNEKENEQKLTLKDKKKINLIDRKKKKLELANKRSQKVRELAKKAEENVRKLQEKQSRYESPGYEYKTDDEASDDEFLLDNLETVEI